MDCDSPSGPIRPVAAGRDSASGSSGLDCLLPVSFCRHGLGGKARTPFDLAVGSFAQAAFGIARNRASAPAGGALPSYPKWQVNENPAPLSN